MSSDLLRPVSLFRGLSDEEIELLNSLFSLREVPAKEKIVAEGMPMHEFYVVCKGSVHARRMAQKREMLLGRIGAGGFFGEINLFNEGTATASVYAAEPVTLAVGQNAELRQFLADNTRIGYKVLSELLVELSSRMRQTNERFVNSLFWSSLSTDTPAQTA
jgi:CRP-like cAMP-binding protein